MIKNKLVELLKTLLNKRNKNSIESKTKRLKAQKKSDIERWSKDYLFYENWNERTKLIGSFLTENADIIEFGAGNMYLKTMLKTNQNYSASDIVKRYPETIVCDLNKTIEIDLSKFDTVIFSGVLEYVYDIYNVFNMISEQEVKYVILSYACSNFDNVSREKKGWLSDFNKNELLKIFEDNNYELLNYSEWKNQSIFNLINKNLNT